MALRQRKANQAEGKSRPKQLGQPERKHPLRWVGLGLVVFWAIYWVRELASAHGIINLMDVKISSSGRLRPRVDTIPQNQLTVDYERRQAVVEAFKVSHASRELRHLRN
jgi:hypothetical protein